MTQIDAHYSELRLAEVYDAGNGWSADRDFYLEIAGSSPIRVLDLGCGTGLLCDAYAIKNHHVTGVDPAASMLEVARRKSNGQKIEWVLATAQSFSSIKRYDHSIITDHAFHVLLEECDVRDTFRIMREHLAENGRIVFESRNPSIDWASRWNKSVKLTLQNDEVNNERKVITRTADRIYFETSYHFSDSTLISQSELRFWTAAKITELLRDCGLEAIDLYGDWDKTSFNPESSEEMIFIVRVDCGRFHRVDVA